MSLETIAAAFGEVGETRVVRVTAMATLRRHVFRVAVSPYALGDYRLGPCEIGHIWQLLCGSVPQLPRGFA